MKRFVLAVLFGGFAASALADVCAEGASLDMPDHRIVARLGLSAIVDARRHPAMQDLDELDVTERAAALEVAFAEEYGDEPEVVQDLRRLGMFVESFNLNSGNDPSLSVVFLEPEFLMATLPTLRAYDVSSGVEALENAQDAFWFFENRRTKQLFNQLMWNSVIGATIDDARDAAPDLLIAARGEVDAAIGKMIAQDASVAQIMEDRRASMSEYQRRSYLESQLNNCVEYGETWGHPVNWGDIRQPQKDMLVLSFLLGGFDDLSYFFSESGWLLDDSIRVLEEQNLPHHAKAMRDALALLPRGMDRSGDEWADAVWEQADAFELIIYEELLIALVEEQPEDADQYQDTETILNNPIRDAFETLAKQTGLWP